MDERVHEMPRARVSEHYPAKAFAIDGLIPAEDGIAESGNGFSPGGASRRHEAMGRFISGMDEAPLITKDAGDDRLAAGDPSCQRDPEHAIFSWRREGP